MITIITLFTTKYKNKYKKLSEELTMTKKQEPVMIKSEVIEENKENDSVKATNDTNEVI